MYGDLEKKSNKKTKNKHFCIVWEAFAQKSPIWRGQSSSERLWRKQTTSAWLWQGRKQVWARAGPERSQITTDYSGTVLAAYWLFRHVPALGGPITANNSYPKQGNITAFWEKDRKMKFRQIQLQRWLRFCGNYSSVSACISLVIQDGRMFAQLLIIEKESSAVPFAPARDFLFNFFIHLFFVCVQ